MGLVILAIITTGICFYNIGELPENDLVKKCEATLPRDQHCKLIAVPDKGE